MRGKQTKREGDNGKGKERPEGLLLKSFRYVLGQSLLLSEVNKGDVLVTYLQKRTEFSGGLAWAIIKG